MFRKLHIQMTAFSTLITGAILAAMTFICLFISEKGLQQNTYSSFTNNVNSCITHLESQSVLSHQWLLEMRDVYGIEIRVEDNGKSLFFDKLNPSAKTQEAFEKASRLSIETQGLDITNYSSASTFSKSALFRMDGYYACTALIPKQGSALGVTMLYSLDALKHQISEQRGAFFLVVLLAIAALAIFSWFFTKKMILPLEESQRRQTQFIASASHELRSPLAVILSSIQAMDKASPEEIRRFSNVIQKEGTRMSRLINDMLSLANADNKSWSLLLSPCELDTLLLDTYEKYETLACEKGLRLSIELPDAPLAPCRCDASRITQVLAILLDNALAYVPSGQSIHLSLTQDAKACHLIVSDTGPGIPDEEKESVFQRFYRADASRNDKHHFGLGLCIAQEIVHLHKGTLKITDTPGGGTTFTLTLPLPPPPK